MDRCVHICLNGHVVITREWIKNKEFCEKCGVQMIDKCPSCNTPIKVWDYGGVAVLGTPKYDRAAYCKHCGKAYPWTQAALDATTEIIREEEELSETQQENLITVLPDIITETPKTNLAAVRTKKALAAAGKFTAEALRNFVIDFGCELAKKQLGL